MAGSAPRAAHAALCSPCSTMLPTIASGALGLATLFYPVLHLFISFEKVFYCLWAMVSPDLVPTLHVTQHHFIELTAFHFNYFALGMTTGRLPSLAMWGPLSVFWFLRTNKTALTVLCPSSRAVNSLCTM